jgi:hypothetical protein
MLSSCKIAKKWEVVVKLLTMRFECATFGLLNFTLYAYPSTATNYPTFIFLLSNFLSYVIMPNVAYHTNLSFTDLMFRLVYDTRLATYHEYTNPNTNNI